MCTYVYSTGEGGGFVHAATDESDWNVVNILSCQWGGYWYAHICMCMKRFVYVYMNRYEYVYFVCIYNDVYVHTSINMHMCTLPCTNIYKYT